MMPSALPMTTEVSITPDRDLDRPLYSIKVRWTWPVGEWTRFSLVRRMNSPARRREEGSVILETRPERWGDPVYEDQSAPPDRWVYYTAFVLDKSRVWQEAGSVFEMGTGDHDWTINLPELLPGVSVSTEQQVVAKADPDHELVEFLQGPGLFYDRVMSYGESVQNFWDPLKVPPNMLPALLGTLGFEPNPTLSDARLRDVARAMLIERPQGSLSAIQAYAAAVTGVPTVVFESHNRMLSPLDSSFEGTVRTDPDLVGATYEDLRELDQSYVKVRDKNFNYRDLLIKTMPGANSLNLIEKSNWTPLDKDLLELRRYEYYPYPAPAIPVEVLDTFFLHFKHGGRIACGEQDPMREGVPVSWWESLRAGVFARGGGVQLTMSVLLYGLNNDYLRAIQAFPPVVLTDDWNWYHTPDSAPIPINQVTDSILESPEMWRSDWDGKAQPQNLPSPVRVGSVEHFEFYWNVNPRPVGQVDEQPATAVQARLVALPGHEDVHFLWTMAGEDPEAGPKQTPWRLVIFEDVGAFSNTYAMHMPPSPTAPASYDTLMNSYASYAELLVYEPAGRDFRQYASGWVQPSGQEVTAGLQWKPSEGVKEAWFGIEVQSPKKIFNTYGRLLDKFQAYGDLGIFSNYWSIQELPTEGGWSVSAMHTAVHAEVRSGTEGRAYWAVPVVEVSGQADIDLVVVDDV